MTFELGPEQWTTSFSIDEVIWGRGQRWERVASIKHYRKMGKQHGQRDKDERLGIFLGTLSSSLG